LPVWATTWYAHHVVRPKTVTTILRELREQRGTTLRRAADDLGIAPSHLSRLERGQKAPSPELAARAADYYGTDGELISLEQGQVPEDIILILRQHPDLLQKLRAEFRNAPEG
jgi:transcriptional regulator with XRE-family HTH domain